jgi:hypothetical protein
LAQVSEKKVILGISSREAVPCGRREPDRFACLRGARRVNGCAKPVGWSQSEREAVQKRALSLNQFQGRIRLHAGGKRISFRARILVNAGYGYRAVKNRPAGVKNCVVKTP